MTALFQIASVLAIKHEDIVVRNPFSTRPYQHVLEPLYAYLMIAAMQYQDIKYAGYYNVGPDDVGLLPDGCLSRFVCEQVGRRHEMGQPVWTVALMKQTS